MDVYTITAGATTVILLLWSLALILAWALRPVASPTLFLRALACVGIVIVCVLAGMSSFLEANDNIASRVVFAVVGLGGLVGAVHQSYRLFTERDIDLRRTGREHGRR